jgi:hypothetical protein
VKRPFRFLVVVASTLIAGAPGHAQILFTNLVRIGANIQVEVVAPAPQDCVLQAANGLNDTAWIDLPDAVRGTVTLPVDRARRFFRIKHVNEYSVNAIGYVSLSLPAGYSLIANQLHRASGNPLSVLLPDLPVGTTVFKYNSARGAFDSHICVGGGTWLPDASLEPGEGAFVEVAAPATITFAGEVRPSICAASGGPGLFLMACHLPIPAPTNLSGMTGGDTLFRFNRITQAYDSYILIGRDIWLPSAPAVDVGEAFFILRESSLPWCPCGQTFTDPGVPLR